MILLEKDLIKNLAKTKLPAGGCGSGGGGSSATKLHIRTFNEFKCKILELEKEEKSSSSLKL